MPRRDASSISVRGSSPNLLAVQNGDPCTTFSQEIRATNPYYAATDNNDVAICGLLRRNVCRVQSSFRYIPISNPSRWLRCAAVSLDTRGGPSAFETQSLCVARMPFAGTLLTSARKILSLLRGSDTRLFEQLTRGGIAGLQGSSEEAGWQCP